MREGIRTSLVAIVCAVAVSGAVHAAASVRNVGGTGSYSSATSAAQGATNTSRAGSLRATGSYVRPSATVSGATKAATGTAKTSTSSRSGSGQRLSIGKYVGAPKSISQSGGAAGGSDTIREDRIENIEHQIEQLEAEKQVILKDTRYITISNDEVSLNTDNLIADLELRPGADGRPVELNADNDTGIKWRYVAREGESQEAWRDLVSWDVIQRHVDFGDVNSYINTKVDNIQTQLDTIAGDISTINNDISTINETLTDKQSQIDNINSSISTINTNMETKLDKNQGTGASGKVMMVDATGHITPGNVVYSTSEVDQLLDSVGDDLDKKLDKNQDRANAGKVLAIGDDGDVVARDITGAIGVDIAGKVDKAQGAANAGKALQVGDDGTVTLSDTPLGNLAYTNNITAADIADRSITSNKLAEGAVTSTELAASITNAITEASALERWWHENSPGEDALLSIGPDGEPQWFLIAE